MIGRRKPTAHKRVTETSEAVVAKAVEYVRELDNPARDLLYRALLREELRLAVHDHEEAWAEFAKGARR